MTDHPSFFELDRWALGDPSAAHVEAHLAACPECKAHVDAVLATPGRPPSQLAARATEPHRLRTVAPYVIAGFAAAAALALIWLGIRRDDAAPVAVTAPPSPDAIRDTHPVTPESFTTVRGAPSAALHVRRGEHVTRWDGESPLLPGDTLRFEVAAEGLGRVTVFAVSGDAAGSRSWTELYAGAVDPATAELLPRAWEVDGRSAEEHLVLALSHAPVTPGDVERAQRHPTPDIWVRAFDLNVEARGEGGQP